MRSRKALALISGGLDSLLAAKTILDQGVLVEGINFFSGFFGEGSGFKNARKQKKAVTHSFSPRWVADQLNIPLHVVDVVEEFKSVLFHPEYGYGSHLNPCLDCKIFMVKKALEWMQSHAFDFLITGEVVGQRPMSQRKETLPLVVKKSDAHDLLLRPLSAKLLAPTLPEREGWVDREKLHDISGRSRKDQIALASKWGFKDIPQPAGGCLLTEACYSSRMRDLWEARGKKDYQMIDIQLLKAGRHLRPRAHFKLMMGRDEVDNAFLEQYKDQYVYFTCEDCEGPLMLLEGDWQEGDLDLAAGILARFSRKGKGHELVAITAHQLDGSTQALMVLPCQEVQENWYI